MASYLCVALVSAVAGIVQSALGFGFGMISVMFYPAIMGSIPQSSAVTTCVAMTASFINLVRYYKNVRLHYVIPTIIISSLIMPLTTALSKQLPTKVLSLVLGIVMLLFAIYYIAGQGKIKLRPTALTASATGAVGGTIGGLFALGGVPVGIYLLNASETKDIYYATMQAYIVITDTYGTIVRTVSGIIVAQTLLWILVGIFGMILGMVIGDKIYKKLNQEALKKLVYFLVGFSGIYKILEFFRRKIGSDYENQGSDFVRGPDFHCTRMRNRV